MKTQIKFYRVILNILFYIFYVLLASVAFSLIFPTIQTILGYNVWLVSNPRFVNIQFGIIIVILIFSFVFRKFFYLPITAKVSTYKEEEKLNTNNTTNSGVNESISEEKKNGNLIEKDTPEKIEIIEDNDINSDIRDSSRGYIEEEIEKKIIKIGDKKDSEDGTTLDIKVDKEII